MKKTKITKLALLVISAMLLFAAAIGIAASAEEAVSPVVYSQNVEYGGNYSLMYAITAESVKGEELTLAVYDNAECSGTAKWSKTVAATEANQETVRGKACYVFTTMGVAAKDMDVQYYVKVTSGEGETVKRYSVAEYFFERLYKNGVAFGTSAADVARAKLYNSALSYAADAQDVLYNYNVNESGELITSDDRTSFVTDMKYVYVADDKATIDGTYSSGIVLQGTELTLTTENTVKGWNIYDLTTGLLIKTVSADEAFTVDTHVKVEEFVEYRGSGLYRDYAVDYTDATHDSLIADKKMYVSTAWGKGTNGIGTNRTLTFNDGAMQYTANGNSNGYGALEFANQDTNNITNTDTALVFETDIMFEEVVFSVARPIGFMGSSTSGGSAGLSGFYIFFAPNANGGYDISVKDGDSTASQITVIATIADGEWVNLRCEMDGTAPDSAVRLYINHSLVKETKLTRSIKGITGIQLQAPHTSGSDGFISGTISLDNTYFGPKQ